MNNYIILALLFVLAMFIILHVISTEYIIFERDLDVFNNNIIDTRIKNIPNDIDKLAFLTDKYLVKGYIDNLNIPNLYIPKTYFYTTKCGYIDWSTIPNSFVIKPTHVSGIFHICRNSKCKKNIDLCNKYIKKSLKQSYNTNWKRILHYNFGIPLIEHHYDLIKPGIIIEELIENNADWKFYVFNGVVQFIIYVNNRETKPYLVYINKNYSIDTSKRRFCHKLYQEKYPPKPKEWDEMITISETIASMTVGNELVRVDLYISNGKIYFGELTFTPAGGRGRVEPPHIMVIR